MPANGGSNLSLLGQDLKRREIPEPWAHLKCGCSRRSGFSNPTRQEQEQEQGGASWGPALTTLFQHFPLGLVEKESHVQQTQ